MREYNASTNCDLCEKLMCDECRCTYSLLCHVCTEKIDRDEDFGDIPDICQDCMESCADCAVSFHPACQAEHSKTCNQQGRAQRGAASATKAVDEKEEEIRKMKCKLAELEVELGDAKNAKSKADKKLKKLQPN